MGLIRGCIRGRVFCGCDLVVNMEITKVEEAADEARRFLERATLWLVISKNDKSIQWGSKEGGALRRASMDLTRALTEMRKS